MQPPMPLASTGCWSFMTQLPTSRLCTCCSQMWSPLEPAEVVPVVYLVLHFAHFGGAGAVPNAVAVPVHAQEMNVAQRPVVDLFDGLDVARLVAALQPDAHQQVFVVGLLVGFHQQPVAGAVDAAGLFHEHVLAGGNGRLVVRGAKAGRRGQHDQRGVAGQGLLIGLQADKYPLLGNIDLVVELLSQPLPARRRPGRQKASATATSLRFLSAFISCPMAPVPRPPAPIRATLITSLPAAWALRGIFKPPANVAPATASDDVFKKSRREDAFELLIVKISDQQERVGETIGRICATRGGWWGGVKDCSYQGEVGLRAGYAGTSTAHAPRARSKISLMIIDYYRFSVVVNYRKRIFRQKGVLPRNRLTGDHNG